MFKGMLILLLATLCCTVQATTQVCTSDKQNVPVYSLMITEVHFSSWDRSATANHFLLGRYYTLEQCEKAKKDNSPDFVRDKDDQVSYVLFCDGGIAVADIPNKK